MTRSTPRPPADGPADQTPGGTADDLEPCDACGQPVARRALFCHACGAVQPPRPLDPFARLGMERRFDLAPDQLARQLAGFTRAMDPARFAARPPRQQANATAQGEALREAHETLRDPVRRARALLVLLGGPAVTAESDDDDDHGETAALAAALAPSPDAAELDRIAIDLGRRIEACIRDLALAFRKADDDARNGAARTLARLERLEALAAEAATRRAGPPAQP